MYFIKKYKKSTIYREAGDPQFKIVCKFLENIPELPNEAVSRHESPNRSDVPEKVLPVTVLPG